MDLFDEKPELTKLSGKPYPGQSKVETLSPSASGNLLGSPFKFQPHGECGMRLSEIIPHIAGIADEITLVRSMTHTDHEQLKWESMTDAWVEWPGLHDVVSR